MFQSVVPVVAQAICFSQKIYVVLPCNFRKFGKLKRFLYRLKEHAKLYSMLLYKGYNKRSLIALNLVSYLIPAQIYQSLLARLSFNISLDSFKIL